jgi:hypothetical protein
MVGQFGSNDLEGVFDVSRPGVEKVQRSMQLRDVVSYFVA